MARDPIINALAAQLRVLQRKVAALEKDKDKAVSLPSSPSWPSSVQVTSPLPFTWNVLVPPFVPYSMQHDYTDELLEATSADGGAACDDGAPLHTSDFDSEAAATDLAVLGKPTGEAQARLDEQGVEQLGEVLVPSALKESAHEDAELVPLLRTKVGYRLALLDTDLLAEAERDVPLKLARSVHNWLISWGSCAPPAAEVTKRISIVDGIMDRLTSKAKWKNKETEDNKEEEEGIAEAEPGRSSVDPNVETVKVADDFKEKQEKTSAGKKAKEETLPRGPTARDIHRTQALLAPRCSRASSCRKPKKGHQQMHGLARRSDSRHVANG